MVKLYNNFCNVVLNIFCQIGGTFLKYSLK